MEKKERFIHQEVLKVIACVTMLIDHFAAGVLPYMDVPYIEEIYYACRIIGRIAFPIYCFLLVEGMRHTRNAGKYILRLAIGILLAELPFDMLFLGEFTWMYQNVMVTLTLGAIMLLCMQKTEKKWLKLLMVLPFAVAADLTKSDYYGWGIAMIAVFALFEKFPLQFLGVAVLSLLMDSVWFQILGVSISVEWFAVLAMLPIGLYSGRKLTRNRAIQWGFYLFYSLHLSILWLVVELIW